MWIQQSIRTTGSSDEQREDGYLFPYKIEVWNLSFAAYFVLKAIFFV